MFTRYADDSHELDELNWLAWGNAQCRWCERYTMEWWAYKCSRAVDMYEEYFKMGLTRTELATLEACIRNPLGQVDYI